MDDSVDAADHRQTRVECMEEELTAEVQRYEHALKIYNRLDKAVSIVSGGCSVGSLLLTSGTMGSALTGIGATASIPLGSLACLCATSCLVLSLIARRVAKKKKKHRDTVRLARTYRSQLAGEDSDGAPTPAICLKNYYDEKAQLRRPSTPFSDDLVKHAPCPR